MLNPLGLGVTPQQPMLTPTMNNAGANLLLGGNAASAFTLPAQASSIPSLMSASQIALAQPGAPSATPGLTMDFQDIGISTAMLQPLLKQLSDEDATIFNQLQSQKLQILSGISTLAADKQSQAMALFMQAKTLQTDMLRTYLGAATNAATQSAMPMPQLLPNLSMDFQAEGVSSMSLNSALNALNPQEAQIFNNLQMQKLQIANGISTLDAERQSLALQLFQQAKNLQANIIKPYLTSLVSQFVPMASAQNAGAVTNGSNSMMGMMMALLGGGKTSSSSGTQKPSGSGGGGGSSTETLTGSAGNDILAPTKNNSILNGLGGNDTYNLGTFSGASIFEDVGQGTDTVQVQADYTLGENLENLSLQGSDNLAGAGNELNNVITGNDGNNLLSGLAGNDTLNGGSGNNTLDGGSGNDTFIVNSTGNTLIEAANGGTDTVQAGISFTLGNHFENLTLTGTATNGTGNELNNVILGNASNNVLEGALGNDTLNGAGGEDTLRGGEGNDVYRMSAADAGNLLINDTSGNADMLELDGFTKSNLTGVSTQNESDLTLTMNNGRTVTIQNYFGANGQAGSGHIETLKFQDGQLNLADIQTMLTQDRQTQGTTQNDTLNGENGNDNINGLAGNDQLNGRIGNDTLNGGEGSDTLRGGVGNDSYVVDNVGDSVVENAGEGVDSVTASVSFSLSPNVENLTLAGSDNINGSGNALDNTLTGNAANNRLDGGNGNDTLNGAGGNDTLNGGEGDDTYQATANGNILINDAGGNNDVLSLTQHSRSDVSVSSASDRDLVLTVADGKTVTIQNYFDGNGQAGAGHIESIQLADGNLSLADIQSMPRNVQGTAQNDNLHGEAGNDVLDGGDGDDTLNGRAGNNTLKGGNGNDTYTGFDAGGVNEIIDDGGEEDNLDLSGFDVSAITMSSANGADLSLDLGMGRQVVIRNYFDADHNATQGTVEKLTFQNSTLNFSDVKNSLFPAPVVELPVQEPEAPVVEPPAEQPETPVTEPSTEQPETPVKEEPGQQPEAPVAETPVEQPEAPVVEEPTEQPETPVTETPVNESPENEDVLPLEEQPAI